MFSVFFSKNPTNIPSQQPPYPDNKHKKPHIDSHDHDLTQKEQRQNHGGIHGELDRGPRNNHHHNPANKK